MTNEQKDELRNKIGTMQALRDDLTRAQMAYEKSETEVYNYIYNLPVSAATDKLNRMGEVTEKTRILRG